MNPTNPMIVQSDKTILLEVDHPQHAEARDALAQFAELEKSPEHIHTYRLSPLSLWNAAAGGMTADQVLALLTQYSKYAIPMNIVVDVREYMNRYGRIKLIRDGDALLLTSDDVALMAEIYHHKRTQPYLIQQLNSHTIQVDASRRGHIKQALIHIGFPAEDLAGYTDGYRCLCNCDQQRCKAKNLHRVCTKMLLRQHSMRAERLAAVAVLLCSPA